MGGYLGHAGEHIFGGKVVFAMVDTEMSRRDACVFHFVVAFDIEAYRISADWLSGNLA